MKPDLSRREYFPGIYHISDAASVTFTLIIPEGQNRALLFDPGYGYLDPKPLVSEILKKHRSNLETETFRPRITTLLCHPEPGTNLIFRKE